jgi:hypothetical protein
MKPARKFYFFRRGFLAAFFADLELGGGGVFSIFRKPSSNPSPFVVMALVFTLLASNLPLF